MGWSVPAHDRASVDAAGATLIDPHASDAERETALAVVNNWRACHAFPLNTFQTRLRQKARALYALAIVAQRTKRIVAIQNKLRRPLGVTLWSMQDIAGCRAIVGTNRTARSLFNAYRRSRLKHNLVDFDDYVHGPKSTGYRGYHLIYEYQSDRNETFNGLKVEIQIRSKLQHAWATAVESVDMVMSQSLKVGAGDPRWRRFFKLMGSAMARLERTPPVRKTPTTEAELVKEIKSLESELEVVHTMSAISSIELIAQDKSLRDAYYFLIELEPERKRTSVRGFTKQQEKEASAAYAEAESKLQGKADAVLVSVDTVRTLKRAYPNYYLDTTAFLQTVRDVIK